MKTKILFLAVIGLLWVRPVQAAVLFPFSGEIDFKNQEMELVLKPDQKHPVIVHAARLNDGNIQFVVDINQFKTGFFEISTLIEGGFNFPGSSNIENPVMHGKVRSKYTLLNGKTIKEIFGEFEVKSDIFAIHSLAVGDMTLKGSFRRKYPFDMDLWVSLNGVAINDFLVFFNPEQALKGEGEVNGDLYLTGQPSRLKIRTRLLAREGSVGGVDFDSILINAQGTYPFVQIENSRVIRDDGMIFTLAGVLDLADRKGFDQQVKALSREPVTAHTDVNSEWTLKRIQSDENTSTDLKYLFRENLDSGPFEESSDLIGVERRMKF